MNKTTLLLTGLACISLQACALHGTSSFTPTGIRLNRSISLGTTAFDPNPYEQQPEQVEYNNYYSAPPAYYNRRTGPNVIIVEPSAYVEDHWN